ncbi:MAG TPA: metallophosphoesterase [Polyangiaceae bacterium]|nr:MAG: Calcineurin-like phosphoesterase [Deltaproteobacteria bacterium ADurb.Bin207]HNS98462.1 metallophosphoesterase [Polyangiaceae bacterium]HNZ23100.1 metallophosphoesterase [Polyangiaceae bacterium]HOD21122.1 metallophosphoesterase [Polyangiaceae bacterium]HOE48891.1 metallophosphoesterase [Polyangiaceae bacterium]
MNVRRLRKPTIFGSYFRWALVATLIVGLPGCSGSSMGESKAVSSRVESAPEPEPERRPAAILAKWFENLPCPLPPPLPFVEGSSTLAVLPDTQVYTDRYPETFERQVRWIVEQKQTYDIRFVLHLGDMTERSSAREWQTAEKTMGLLDGVIPYAIATGNHDYEDKGWANTRRSPLSTHFPVAKMRKVGALGGTYNAGVLDNSYHLFSAGNRDWIALMLEWGPRRGVVDWANKVLQTYADRTAIVVTHAYLFHDNSRYDRIRDDQPWNPHHYPTAKLPGGVSDGEELWNDLISHHGNIAMVLCGHVLGDGAGYLASKGDVGNTVHQMLSNFQMMPGGGRGYMRLLELLPDGKTVQVKTYSPMLDDFMTDDQHQFVIELDVRLGRPCKNNQPCDPYADRKKTSGDGANEGG